MKRPKAILFDLCDTLFLFDAQRLPVVSVEGTGIRSTTGLVHQILTQYVSIPFEAFYQAFVETTQAIVQDREQNHREITSDERFERVLQQLHLEPGQIPSTVLTQIVQIHMNTLADALYLPPSHRTVIEQIKDTYLIGIITNFDHAPTVHQLLLREGLANHFKPVVISAEVGWRKPRQEIFQRALDLLGFKAQDILFVGNDLKIDVAGAHAAGIPTVWFNRHNEAPDPTLPIPDYSLSRLEKLHQIT